LSDNLKSAVLERAGDAIRFNPQMLEFAAHYHYVGAGLNLSSFCRSERACSC
jgi:hypothetical protein